MSDPNKRALLIEAVIAGGLIVIGIPAGQPLLALAAGVGANWAHSLAERGFRYWCDRWFTDDGVLNQDIAKALCHAFVDAVRQVEHDWKQHRHYQYLRHKSSEQAQLTLDTLRLLREDGATLLQQSDQFAQVAQQQQHDRVLSLLDQGESKANESLRSMLAAFLYGHDDEFVTFVTEQLGPKWILRFLEILKDPDEEGTRAWRACQLLWQKSLLLGIQQIRQTTTETAETVRWLQIWAQRLQSLPPTGRDPTGQDALEKIILSVQAELDEMQKTLDKTYITTLDIKARVEQVYQKVAPVEMTPSQVWNVRYRRNPFFTGREDVLNRLHEYLTLAKTAALTQPPAISGLGGIGKTQIAIEYAYRYRDEYKYVLWVNASEPVTLTEGFVQIARILQLPVKEEQDQNIVVEAVKQWLTNSEGWLLILDNADDLPLAYTFLPTTGKGHILLTTREHKTGRIACGFEVKPMEREDGVLFLLRRSKVLDSSDAPLTQIKETDQQVAADIVKEMEGLPLALDQVGAYIEEMECDLLTYLQRYRQNQHQFELLKRRGRLETDYPNAVAITWSLNFNQVEQKSSIAADLLRFFAFLAPEAIPEELIVNGANELGPQLQPITADAMLLNEAIDVLRRFSLVGRNITGNTLSIHRLVQAVLKESLNKRTRREWAERTVRAVKLAFPDVTDVKLWEHCERYLPHTLVCATLIEEYSFAFAEAPHLLDQTAEYLYGRAQYPQAEPLYQRALSIREQQLGPMHPDTAASLNNLAVLYQVQGKYEQAEPLLKRALSIREQQLGSLHPDVVTNLNNLAALYQDQGKYEQAEPLYTLALAIREKMLGPEHPDTATSLNNLARLYDTQGKYSLAQRILQRALSIREQQLGPEHPNTAASLNNLAGLYYAQGKYEQAKPLYIHALAIYEKMLGPEHPDTATSLNNLAWLHYVQGKYEQAEPLLKRALAICEKMLGPEHPDTATSLNNLARLYEDQGKYEQAEPPYQRALSIREQQLGPMHPDTAGSLNNLAALYQDQGKYEQAKPLLKRALAICEKMLGPEHPNTAASLNNLASLYRAQGKYEQAEPPYQRALAIREKQLGLEHPDTAGSLNNLARLYEDQGKYEQAEPLLKRALAIVEKQLGPEHPDTVTVRENYSALVSDMKQKGKGQH